MLEEGDYFWRGKIGYYFQVIRAFLDQLEDFLEQDLTGLERSVEFVACVDQLE